MTLPKGKKNKLPLWFLSSSYEPAFRKRGRDYFTSECNVHLSDERGELNIIILKFCVTKAL